MPSFAGVASSMAMLLLGFLVGHYELHTTLPTQLITSFTQMEHKVRTPPPPPATRPSIRTPARHELISGPLRAAYCARRLRRP